MKTEEQLIDEGLGLSHIQAYPNSCKSKCQLVSARTSFARIWTMEG